VNEVLQNQSIYTITLPTPFPVGPVNVYVVRGDAIVLFDTGPKTRGAYEALEAGLKGLGLQPADLDVIIVTHGHLDHVGLLKRLVEASGAATYGHPYVVSQWTYSEEKAHQRREYFTALFKTYGVPAVEASACIEHWNSYRVYTDEAQLDHAIEEGASIAGFDTYHLPGHSPSDLVFVDRRRGLSITGDHLLPDMSPNPLMRKPLPGQAKSKSLLEFQHSLRRSRALELGICCPGHGPVFGNHREVIDRLLERHDRRTHQIRGLLRQRAMTPYAVTQKIFPRLETNYLYLGISAAIGHLEIIEEEGGAVAEMAGDLLVFRAPR
jgi:glyoxylase-like metal-dependent hydrolase (beta-lactamase superfamily II)